MQCRSAWYLFVRQLFSCLHHCKENARPETKIPLGMVLRPANLRVLPWTKAPQGVSSLHFWKVYLHTAVYRPVKSATLTLQRVIATNSHFSGGEFTHSRAMKTYACWNSPPPPSFPPAAAPSVPSPYFLFPSLSP